MKFVNRFGEVIEFNVLDQKSIDIAKSKSFGEGIGSSIANELINLIKSGKITKLNELPDDYKHIGKLCNLQE